MGWICFGLTIIIIIAVLFLKVFDRIAGRDIAHEMRKAQKKIDEDQVNQK
jgi:hypothetical protein